MQETKLKFCPNCKILKFGNICTSCQTPLYEKGWICNCGTYHLASEIACKKCFQSKS